jgi:hypothetical protein
MGLRFDMGKSADVSQIFAFVGMQIAEPFAAIRAGHQRHEILLAVPSRSQTAGRFEQGNYGEVPAGDAQILFKQESAAQKDRILQRSAV